MRHQKTWSTILFLSLVFTLEIQPLANLVDILEVIKHVKRSEIYSPSDCKLLSGAFTASSSLVQDKFLNYTYSCLVPLTWISVGVTDVNANCFLNFNFQNSEKNWSNIQNLITGSGIYVGVQCSTNSNSQNVVSAIIMDSSGNIKLKKSHTLKAGVGGLTQFSVGFNTKFNVAANGTTALSAEGVLLTKTVFYQQQPTTASPVGGQTVPVPIPLPLTAPTPILTPSASPVIGTSCAAPFGLPVQNMKYKKNTSGVPNVAPIPDAFNATAVSCSGGLQNLSVDLTDATGELFYSFNFDEKLIFSNSKIQQLCTQGMYIMVKMLNNPTSSSSASGTSGVGNFAQVCLMDNTGAVYAWSTTAALPANCGCVFANIGFNMTDTTVNTPGNNQTYINWVPVAAAKPVFYQGNGSTTPPSSGHGSQATPPPVKTITLNVPATTGKPASTQVITVTPLELSPASIAYYNAAANPCTPTPGTFPNVSSSISSTFGGTTYSTKSGKLDNLQVGVTDANAQCFLVFAFGSDIIGAEQMQALIQEGMYVGVVCAPASSGNTVTVQLTDASGTVYASGTYSSAAGALSQYYVGFDTNISELMSPVQAGQFVSAANAAKLQANAIRKFAQKVPLTQTVYYKQLPASSAS